MADLAADAFFGFAVGSGQGCYLDHSTPPFPQRPQRDGSALDAARDRVGSALAEAIGFALAEAMSTRERRSSADPVAPAAPQPSRASPVVTCRQVRWIRTAS